MAGVSSLLFVATALLGATARLGGGLGAFLVGVLGGRADGVGDSFEGFVTSTAVDDGLALLEMLDDNHRDTLHPRGALPAETRGR